MGPVATVPIAARPLLQYVGGGCDSWALGTYEACEFRCAYCITGAQGSSTPLFDRSEVASRLRAELGGLGPDARVSVGSLCDAYPSVEAHHGVTRAAVEELVAQDRAFVVITKGTTVRRDVDLLLEASDARVTVSLASVDEAAIRRIDPRAPGAQERVDLVHELAALGVRVKISAAPWIPGVTDAEALIDRFAPEIPILFAALDVLGPAVRGTPYARRFRQTEVDEAFRAEFARVGPRRNVRWEAPVPADGPDRCRTPGRVVLRRRG